jgi:acetyl/propionyl-CoA carboxylase alpha subunit
MFDKVLIANRGEIAVRVIRACREMGIRSCAVHSEADRKALHVLLADEAISIGPAPASESYLVIPKILDAAKRVEAEAIHPGYGFLAENADFSAACADAGIAFIGPTASAINDMGDKAVAKSAVSAAGVPVVPGSRDPVGDGEAKNLAKDIGYPVLPAATICSSRSWWRTRGTWKRRSSPTSTCARCSSGSASAPCSAAIRR